MELLREHGAQVGAKYYSTVQMTAKSLSKDLGGKFRRMVKARHDIVSCSQQRVLKDTVSNLNFD
jgi:hypothetical protein